MPTKFDKVSFVVSLIFVLPVAAWALWLDTKSGMWKSDLAALSAVVGLIASCATAYWIGYRLRGKIHPTEAKFNRFLIGGLIALVGDCTLIVLVAFTIGYQPWLMFLVGPIFILGLACLAEAALLRGSMHDLVERR